MNEINRSRFRPVLVAILLTWLLLSPDKWKVDPNDGVIFPEILAIILLASLLIFKIKEKISISNNHIYLNLHKNNTKINLSSIKKLTFGDCFNILNVETNDTDIKVDISQFNSRKVKKLFIESGLYKSEKD